MVSMQGSLAELRVETAQARHLSRLASGGYSTASLAHAASKSYGSPVLDSPDAAATPEFMRHQFGQSGVAAQHSPRIPALAGYAVSTGASGRADALQPPQPRLEQSAARHGADLREVWSVLERLDSRLGAVERSQEQPDSSQDSSRQQQAASHEAAKAAEREHTAKMERRLSSGVDRLESEGVRMEDLNPMLRRIASVEENMGRLLSLSDQQALQAQKLQDLADSLQRTAEGSAKRMEQLSLWSEQLEGEVAVIGKLEERLDELDVTVRRMDGRLASLHSPRKGSLPATPRAHAEPASPPDPAGPQAATSPSQDGAVDEIREQLFELRVELQNHLGDTDINVASIKRKAELAEQLAEEAKEAVEQLQLSLEALQAASPSAPAAAPDAGAMDGAGSQARPDQAAALEGPSTAGVNQLSELQEQMAGFNTHVEEIQARLDDLGDQIQGALAGLAISADTQQRLQLASNERSRQSAFDTVTSKLEAMHTEVDVLRAALVAVEHTAAHAEGITDSTASMLDQQRHELSALKQAEDARQVELSALKAQVAAVHSYQAEIKALQESSSALSQQHREITILKASLAALNGHPAEIQALKDGLTAVGALRDGLGTFDALKMEHRVRKVEVTVAGALEEQQQASALPPGGAQHSRGNTPRGRLGIEASQDSMFSDGEEQLTHRIRIIEEQLAAADLGDFEREIMQSELERLQDER
ncbi:hypothetical protein WJX72_003705 [[Myrmecia] bisecta]|uniref:Uncharacterized protein n=1 Tax=[Myrmecia] bisecta TaxID=41462 RepID=A0AAW1QAI0_9CHLO